MLTIQCFKCIQLTVVGADDDFVAREAHRAMDAHAQAPEKDRTKAVPVAPYNTHHAGREPNSNQFQRPKCIYFRIAHTHILACYVKNYAWATHNIKFSKAYSSLTVDFTAKCHFNDPH